MLALLLNQALPFISVFRAIYFAPVVVSMVVVSLLWRFIYDGEKRLAQLPYAGHRSPWAASQPVDWLGNPYTAMPAMIAMSAWQAVGFHMVIWLSGLQTIPTSLYEAAGTGRRRRLAEVPLRDLAPVCATQPSLYPDRHRYPGDGFIRSGRRHDARRPAGYDAECCLSRPCSAAMTSKISPKAPQIFGGPLRDCFWRSLSIQPPP